MSPYLKYSGSFEILFQVNFVFYDLLVLNYSNACIGYFLFRIISPKVEKMAEDIVFVWLKVKCD